MKTPFLYRLFQLWVNTSLHIFYKKIEITGLKKIPKDEPVLLALNHQNAFMDAIAPVALIKQSTHFLVRADVFKKKIAQWFFKQVNMMPIYRIRDGYENMHKNDLIFDKCYDLLSENGNVLIFPEGNHANQKMLRPLKKGIARIAFGAGEKTNFSLPLKIVPIGIDYSNYENFRSRLYINIGDPIEVNKYYEDYRENNSEAITVLKDDVEQALEATMLNFSDEKNYEEWKFVSDHLFREKTLSEKWKQQKEWSKKVNTLAKEQPENTTILAHKIARYRQLIEQLEIKDFLFNEKVKLSALLLSTLTLFILFPFYLLGVINNLIPFQVINGLIGKIKDTHFHSSIKLVAGMFLVPIFYVLQIWLVFTSTDLTWLEWGYAALLLPSGWFALQYMPRHKKLFGRWRFWQLERAKNKDWVNAKSLRNELLQAL